MKRRRNADQIATLLREADRVLIKGPAVSTSAANKESRRRHIFFGDPAKATQAGVYVLYCQSMTGLWEQSLGLGEARYLTGTRGAGSSPILLERGRYETN